MRRGEVDNWHKPRGKGEHLTPDEIAKVREAFDAKRTPADIARELQCSTRVATKYFRNFRVGDVPVVVKRFRPQIQNRRFYTSNFEL